MKSQTTMSGMGIHVEINTSKEVDRQPQRDALTSLV